jgi:hypothetical protein
MDLEPTIFALVHPPGAAIRARDTELGIFLIPRSKSVRTPPETYVEGTPWPQHTCAVLSPEMGVGVNEADLDRHYPHQNALAQPERSG